MSDLPPKAKIVVIGAGIVGNSLVYHLARHGWQEIVLLDKGPLPNPGGSTGHASNFIFPVDHSKEMTMITLDSVRQYQELGVFTQSGGIEVARTDERMEELRRRMASAIGTVPRQKRHQGRLLHAQRRRGGLAAGGHADARICPGKGGAPGVPQYRN